MTTIIAALIGAFFGATIMLAVWLTSRPKRKPFYTPQDQMDDFLDLGDGAGLQYRGWPRWGDEIMFPGEHGVRESAIITRRPYSDEDGLVSREEFDTIRNFTNPGRR